MAENKIMKKKSIIYDWIKEQIFLFVVVIAAVLIASKMYHLSEICILRNVVMAFLSMFCIIFRLRQIQIEKTEEELNSVVKKLDYELMEDKKHAGKYYIWFFLGIMLSVIFPLMPVSGWPYPVLAVILALYSDRIIGLFSVSLFIFTSVVLAEADFSVFYLYFITCAISILLFQKIDETFKIYVPLFLSELSILIGTTAEVFLMNAGHISIESFIIPVINMFLTVLFYLIFLKYYSVSSIHKYTERYMIIADQEYDLMVSLKEKSKESYYRAIHTAYFSYKIADKIGCNSVLAKAGAYYHNLSDFCDGNKETDFEELLKINSFPPELCELLLSYHKKRIVSKEAAIIYLSDMIVNSITYIYKKDSKTEIEFDKLIEVLFDKKMASGVLNKCNLTLTDWNTMKNIFKEEKLYYDFLR